MPTLAIIMLALLSLLAGALIEPPAVKAAGKAKPPTTGAERQGTGPGFQIVSEEVSATSGIRFAAVVLPARVVEAEITRIADLVRAKEKAPFEKTVVNFYLPGMKIGHGAWAVATFQPNLKIAILGLRLDEEQAAVAAAKVDRRNLVGVWLTAPPAAPGRLTIYKDAGRTFAEWHLRNGAKSVEELSEAKDSRGRRLTPRSGGSDYYLLGWNGELELRDGQTVIATAERLSGLSDKPATRPAATAAAPVARRREAPAARSAADGSTSSSQSVFKF